MVYCSYFPAIEAAKIHVFIKYKVFKLIIDFVLKSYTTQTIYDLRLHRLDYVNHYSQLYLYHGTLLSYFPFLIRYFFK